MILIATIFKREKDRIEKSKDPGVLHKISSLHCVSSSHRYVILFTYIYILCMHFSGNKLLSYITQSNLEHLITLTLLPIQIAVHYSHTTDLYFRRHMDAVSDLCPNISRRIDYFFRTTVLRTRFEIDTVTAKGLT